MAELGGHEILLTKRPQLVVPAMCAGCGGEVAASHWLVRRKGPRILIGLCAACSATHRMRARAAPRIGMVALCAGLALATVALFAPPLPFIVLLVGPVLVATAAALALCLRLRPVAVTTDSVAPSPYRSTRFAASPPAPVELTRVDGDHALLFCSSTRWAAEFAEANGFERRSPTARPRIAWAFTLSAVAIALVAWAASAVAFHQWRPLHLDNTTGRPVTVWLDGRPLLEVPHLAEGERPISVRVARGHHRITHGPAATPELPELDLGMEGFFARDQPVYDVGAIGCYYRYAVVYSEASYQQVATWDSYYPPSRLTRLEASYFFSDPPQTLWVKGQGSQPVVRHVVTRDPVCAELARRGAAKGAIGDYRDCVVLAHGPEAIDQCGALALAAAGGPERPGD